MKKILTQLSMIAILLTATQAKGVVMDNTVIKDEHTFDAKIIELTSLLKKHPTNKNIKENLVIVSIQRALHLREIGQNNRAIEVLEDASVHNTSIYQLHMLLAKLYFDRGDLLDTKKHISIALLTRPEDPYLLQFNTRVMYLLEEHSKAIDSYAALVQSGAILFDKGDALALQKEQKRAESYHKLILHPFVIYYPDERFKTQAELAGKELLDTYFRLAGWMGFNASHEISVYLYTQSQYQDVAGQSHSVGVYDGKIRILAGGRTDEDIKLTATHELTHHVLAYMTGNTLPFWLNEGLAQYISGEHEITAILKNVPLESHLIEFNALEKNVVQQCSHNELRAAYAQSYVTVNYLIDTYGEEIIVEILAGLSNGASIKTVMQDVMLVNYEELLREVKVYCIDTRNADNKKLVMIKKN